MINDEGYNEEPWRCEGGNNSAAALWIVADTPSGNEIPGAADPFYRGVMIAESICRPNAERIVACVNACRGFSATRLRAVANGDLRMTIEELTDD